MHIELMKLDLYIYEMSIHIIKLIGFNVQLNTILYILCFLLLKYQVTIRHEEWLFSFILNQNWCDQEEQKVTAGDS